MPKDLLLLTALLLFLVTLYDLLRKRWLLAQQPPDKRPRKPALLRPNREQDCRFCQADKTKQRVPQREQPLHWSCCKGKGGPKKQIKTQGYCCPNGSCTYYGIMEENIHALVGYGTHGKHETIQDFKCQACGKKFTARKNTVLYRLKSHSQLVEKILWLLVLGVDASALEEVFGVRESTIRTWLCRSGMHSKKLHDRLLAELTLVQVQLDELWANVQHGGQETWL